MNNDKNISSFIKILLLVFIVGGIFGYVYEEIFYYIEDGFITNRGVLFGPFLPVYAFGALFMYLFLRKLKKYPVVVFVLSIIITGITEYVTGYYLLYHDGKRLWDYTGLFLNINGFVCLRSVISFAISGLFLIYLVSPMLEKFVYKRKVLTNIIIIIFFVLLIVDMILVSIYR